MKKSTIFTLSLMILVIPLLNAQWDGQSTQRIKLDSLPDKTYSEFINVQSPITIQGTLIDAACAVGDSLQLIAKQIPDMVEITICGNTKEYIYELGEVSIINDLNNMLIFTQPPINSADTVNANFDFEIDPTVLNVYYDALVLLNGSNSQKEIIYNKYGLSPASLQSNTFLAMASVNLGNLQAQNDKKNVFDNSNAKGINITRFADGFAKFIASRFKKELTISFFNRFKNKLNDNNLRDLRTLFKNTSADLNLIDDKFTHYEAYLSSLRESMELDCSQLPEQLKTLVESPTSQLSEALASKPNFQYLLDNILTFGIELSDSVNVGKALANLNLKKNFNANPVDTNLMGSLQTLQLISESLRNIETSSNHSYWITDDEIKNLFSNEDLFHLFFGLLAEKAKSDRINLSSGSLFSVLMSKPSLDMRNLIESVISSIKSVEDIYSNNKGLIPDDNKYMLAIRYFDAASALINTSDNLAPLLPKNESIELKSLDTYATDINNMTRSFTTKKYSIGLLYLSRVLSKIDSTNETLKKINSVIGNQGLFIAQMAQSENSDDVAAILENFAAPTGSWRDKRLAEWNIAIDSYIGPAFYNVQDNDQRIAFSTPVGASVTIPFNHVTFFLSAFDLGPLTSFRLTNDTSQIANVYLKEILSPGAFVSINFGDNFPITINAGYQQFPLLEKVGVTENAVNVNREGGFTGSIVMNIPLFTLYNDPKN